MFGLDPFSRPVAIVEIVLLLALAAFIGWVAARLMLNGRIRSIRAEIAEKESALADCRRTKAKTSGNHRETAPVHSVVSPLSSKATTVPMAEDVSITQLETTSNIAGQSITNSTIQPVINAVPPSGLPAGVVATGSSEAAVLSRIASRSSELNFDRIGRATAAEADDLKDIVGIGPFLERKLHSLGIFTFRQVSNFTKEDISKVNEIIEFFPGRIDRDNWIGQAKSFFESKYGE